MPTRSFSSAWQWFAACWMGHIAAAMPQDQAPAPKTPEVAVTYHLISLERFSRKPLSHYRSTDSWAIPPRGRQVIKGVPFLIEGKAEVTGLGAARDGSFLPTRITGIPVGAMGQTIHLLHGAGYAAKDGTPMAEMVLNYRNGVTRSFVISYGVHCRNWYEEAAEPTRAVSHPNSKIGWYGARQDTGFNPSLRLYTTALRNPLPGELIETIEVYSLFSRATPALVALTLAEETVGSSSDIFEPAAPAGTDAATTRSTLRAECKVRVLDQRNQAPLTNALVNVSSTDGTKWISFGQLAPPGSAILDYPPSGFQLVRLTAVAPGYAPHSLVFAPRDDGRFAPELEIKLERGRTIGGWVHDAEDQPILGVQIVGRTSILDENERPILVDHFPVWTDQKGKWELSGIPPRGVVQIACDHPRHERRLIQLDPERPETRTLPAELWAREARLLMERGRMVRGTIIDSLDQPIPGAELIWGQATLAWTNETRTRTGGNGNFEFMATERGPITVAVLATSYAPRLFNVVAGPDLKPFTLALAKAKRLHGRVVDLEGTGIEGVTVTVDQWQQTRCLNWLTQTDKEGRFVWDTPPASAVELGFNRVGYKPIRRQSMTVSDEEFTVRLAPSVEPAAPRARSNKVLF